MGLGVSPNFWRYCSVSRTYHAFWDWLHCTPTSFFTLAINAALYSKRMKMTASLLCVAISYWTEGAKISYCGYGPCCFEMFITILITYNSSLTSGHGFASHRSQGGALLGYTWQVTQGAATCCEYITFCQGLAFRFMDFFSNIQATDHCLVKACSSFEGNYKRIERTTSGVEGKGISVGAACSGIIPNGIRIEPTNPGVEGKGKSVGAACSGVDNTSKRVGAACSGVEGASLGIAGASKSVERGTVPDAIPCPAISNATP